MRRVKPPKWKDDPDLEGMFAFAQSLDEILSGHAQDSFRGPGTDLQASIMETRSVLRQLMIGRTDADDLACAIEGLCRNLQIDPIVPSPAPIAWEMHAARFGDLKATPEKSLLEIDALLVDIVSLYWDALKGAITQRIRNPQQKDVIGSLTLTFTTEIALRGFSRRHAYFHSRGFFFDSEQPPSIIEDTSAIHDFLSLFDRKGRARNVIQRCAREYNEFAELTPSII